LYEEGQAGPERPIVRDIEIRNVTCGKSEYALELRGFGSSPIRDIRLENCSFDRIAKPNVLEHVEGLKLTSVTMNGKPMAGL
jgi:hypothetical protein